MTPNALAEELVLLRSEHQEQARLLGMGSEREVRLMAQLEEARRELQRMTIKNDALMDRLTQIEQANVDRWKDGYAAAISKPQTPRGDTMTPDQIDLARRLVACPRWRWLPGMLAVEWPTPRMGLTERPIRVDRGWPDVGVYLPDLTDSATAGCLLAVVVAAEPGAGWGVSCGPDVGWRATSWYHDLSGATCGEAVARALLVVWEAAS